MQAGGVGVDLTRARVCAYYSLGFSLGEYLQSRKRTHRPGQTRSVLYVHLVAEGTIDEQVYRALEARQDVIAAVLASGR
jgi:SNF2 family DNA or RNA helicase